MSTQEMMGHWDDGDGDAEKMAEQCVPDKPGTNNAHKSTDLE